MLSPALTKLKTGLGAAPFHSFVCWFAKTYTSLADNVHFNGLYQIYKGTFMHKTAVVTCLVYHCRDMVVNENKRYQHNRTETEVKMSQCQRTARLKEENNT